MTDTGAETGPTGPARANRLLAWARLHWPALVVALLAVLLLPQAAALPGAGLDPSWTLALEHAAREGRMFGSDFVFTYGPFGVLTTRLFDPGTFGFVLLGDLVLTGLFLVPLFWSRRPAVLLLYGIAILAAALAPLALDARVTIAFLVVFLMAVRERGRWAWLALLLLSPFLLTKFSYALAALPLLALADAYRLVMFRRIPVLTAIAFAALVLGMLATGHSLGALPGLAANVMEVISGYSSAMQSAIGGIYPLLAAFAAMLVILGLCLVALWRRGDALAVSGRRLLPVAAVILGLAWTFFVAFKMGHVRQDLHIFITWHAFVMGIAVMAAFLDGARALARRELVLTWLLMAGSLLPIAALDAVNYMKFTNPSPVAYLGQRAVDLVVRPVRTLAWLNPGHWQSMTDQRRAAEVAIAARLPVPAVGTMDVIPLDAAPVIVSAADYRPRPVPQSYSSYTPHLQALDAAHFESSASAPATLFLKIGDIDERLPTLATGPSLPVIARWYDAVGASPLGLILHRRAAPRESRSEGAGQADFALGGWVNVPPAGAGLLLARIEIGPSLVGRAIGFLAREPMLWITLRYDNGAERTFRYVPGMGRSGFVLSPMPLDPDLEDLRGAAALIERAYAPDAVRGVVAFRFSGSGLGASAFTGGHVAFERFLLAPGFTAGLPVRIAAPPPNRPGAGTSPPAPPPAG